jgi:hypothetical protein
LAGRKTKKRKNLDCTVKLFIRLAPGSLISFLVSWHTRILFCSASNAKKPFLAGRKKDFKKLACTVKLFIRLAPGFLISWHTRNLFVLRPTLKDLSWLEEKLKKEKIWPAL